MQPATSRRKRTHVVQYQRRRTAARQRFMVIVAQTASRRCYNAYIALKSQSFQPGRVNESNGIHVKYSEAGVARQCGSAGRRCAAFCRRSVQVQPVQHRTMSCSGRAQTNSSARCGGSSARGSPARARSEASVNAGVHAVQRQRGNIVTFTPR